MGRQTQRLDGIKGSNLLSFLPFVQTNDRICEIIHIFELRKQVEIRGMNIIAVKQKLSCKESLKKK